jgi:hypothetical protein
MGPRTQGLQDHGTPEIGSVREAKKAEVLVSVIDQYLVLLTDTVTVLSEAAASQMFLPPAG